MFLLLAVVFAGSLTSVLMGLQTVREVRVGGALYTTIMEYKDLLERIALLKADLNQIRSEVLNLILETESDKSSRIEESLDLLVDEIDAHFEAALAAVRQEEKQIALEDARTTWREFRTDLRGDLLPMIHEDRRLEARDLANGLQKMRYDRFIEQISGMVDVLGLEIEELEDQAGFIVRQKMMTSGAASAGIFLVVVVVLVLVTRSITRPVSRPPRSRAIRRRWPSCASGAWT